MIDDDLPVSLSRTNNDDNDNMNGSTSSIWHTNNARPLAKVARPKPIATSERFMQCSYVTWKFCIHIAVVIAVTAQVVLLSDSDLLLTRHGVHDWNRMLLGPDLEANEDGDIPLVTLQQTVDSVERMVRTYYQFNQSVDNFDYPTNDGMPSPLVMKVKAFDDLHQSKVHRLKKGVNTYLLTPDDMGPLSSSSAALQEFFRHVQWITIEFDIQHLELSYNRFCILWHIVYRLSFASRGHLKGSLEPESSFCGDALLHDDPPAGIIALYTIIVILSIISVIVLFIPIVSYVRRLITHKYFPALRPRTTNARRKFSIWWIIGLTGDFLNLSGACIALEKRVHFVTMFSDHTLHTLFAFGVLFSWIRLLPATRLLGSEYSAFFYTSKAALPLVVRFLLAILPIWFGYVMFGTYVFSKSSPRFATVGGSSITMFGAANGDDIEKTFTSMGNEHSLIMRIYMYTAVILFANVVVRIFLSGIQYFVFLQVPQMEIEQVLPPPDQQPTHTPTHVVTSKRVRYFDYIARRRPIKNATSSVRQCISYHEHRMASIYNQLIERIIVSLRESLPLRVRKPVSAPSSPDMYQDYDTDGEQDDTLHSVQLPSSMYIETQLCRHALSTRPCHDTQLCIICHLSQCYIRAATDIHHQIQHRLHAIRRAHYSKYGNNGSNHGSGHHHDQSGGVDSSVTSSVTHDSIGATTITTATTST